MSTVSTPRRAAKIAASLQMFARSAPVSPDADEHLHERGSRLREERGAGLMRNGLGQQRLARAGRPVEEYPLGHLGAQLAEALGIAQVVDYLSQLVLGLVRPGDFGPSDR